MTDLDRQKIVNRALNLARENSTVFQARQPNKDYAVTSAQITTSRGPAHLTIGVIRNNKGLGTEINIAPIAKAVPPWEYKLVAQTDWPNLYGDPVETADGYMETTGIEAPEVLTILNENNSVSIRPDTKLAALPDSVNLFLADASSANAMGDLARMIKVRG